jgi:hypothetical protein
VHYIQDGDHVGSRCKRQVSRRVTQAIEDQQMNDYILYLKWQLASIAYDLWLYAKEHGVFFPETPLEEPVIPKWNPEWERFVVHPRQPETIIDQSNEIPF